MNIEFYTPVHFLLDPSRAPSRLERKPVKRKFVSFNFHVNLSTLSMFIYLKVASPKIFWSSSIARVPLYRPYHASNSFASHILANFVHACVILDADFNDPFMDCANYDFRMAWRAVGEAEFNRNLITPRVPE